MLLNMKLKETTLEIMSNYTWEIMTSLYRYAKNIYYININKGNILFSINKFFVS